MRTLGFLLALAAAPLAFASAVPRPVGIYVVNEASNEIAVSSAYAQGLTTSPGYANDVAGHAIFVPIAKLLPGGISTWGQFNWDWSYVDTLVQVAVANGKRFSIELETGFQSGSTYLQSLPPGFQSACGANCAPLFDVWTTGGGSNRCISAYVPLPWVPNVQQFWDAAANALAAHLRQTGAYASLTLVHIPGLSVYDEEVRLPTGNPAPSSGDTSVCPDGRSAVSAVASDASASRWQSLGYSDAAVVSGFQAIAGSFARAFPDRYLAYSVFPAGAKGIDFPNFTNDAPGTVAGELVKALAALAPGRIEIQADALDSNAIDSEVTSLAAQNGAEIGWQSNKHGGTGAGCGGGGSGSCNPDGASGAFFQLLLNGAQPGARYVEVWSADVVAYPQALAGAKAAALYQPNYEALWWADPAGSESGWGVNVAHQGDILFATWFTYDTDGSGMWLVVPDGAKSAEGTYSGALYRTTGPAFDAVPFDPTKVKATQVGTATFTFADEDNGTFSYTVNGLSQSKAIVRQVYGATPTCAANLAPSGTPNYQDLWWNPNESGWGVNVTHQGDILFATWFTYGSDGRGMWLVMPDGAKSAAGTYSGSLYRTTGPAFDSASFDPTKVAATQVGTATFSFATAASGTFSYTVNGVTQSKAITRQVFSMPATTCE